MAKFIKVPGLDEARTEAAPSPIEEFLLGFGIDTGHIGAALLALSVICAVVVIVQFVKVISGGAGKYAQGEIVDVQPAPGGGLNPVVRYQDKGGRSRQFIGQFRVGEGDIGRPMRLKVNGDRPTPAPPPPNPARQAVILVLPLLIGAVSMTMGLTGGIPGLVSLPL